MILFIVITGTAEYSVLLILFDHNSVFSTNKFLCERAEESRRITHNIDLTDFRALKSSVTRFKIWTNDIASRDKFVSPEFSLLNDLSRVHALDRRIAPQNHRATRTNNSFVKIEPH